MHYSNYISILLTMKKIILIALIALSIGCKKSNDNNPVDNSIKSNIVGTWVGTKNATTYTDLSGKAQVYNSEYMYVYIITDKTAAKMYGTANIYIDPARYTITSANGKNYINFYDNPGVPTEFDTYQIVSVTAHSLVLNIIYGKQQGDIIPGTNAIGTDAVLDEEYTK